MDFNDSEDYPNTCNDVAVYLEALVLSKYVRLSVRRPIKVSFVTFDPHQGLITTLCLNNPEVHDILKLLVEEMDISQLNILYSRQFPRL